MTHLNSGSWAGFTHKSYEFAVFQANPIASSQSVLVVRDAPANRTGVISEPSTLLLLAASGMALVVSRRKVAKA